MKSLRFFFLGIISAFGSLFMELALEVILFPESIAHFKLPTSITFILLSAVVIEEGIKYIILKKILPSPSSKLIFSSLSFAAGFGLTESTFVFFSTPVFSYYFLAGILIIHLITAGWACYFLQTFYSFHSRLVPLFTLFIMTIIHLGYNGLIIYNFSVGIIYAYLITFSLILLLMFRRIQRATS